jgi:hypothetical protein
MKNIKTNRINIDELLEYYKTCGNAIKTGVKFGLSGPTILKIVRSHGVPVNGEYKKYTDEFVISKYHECGTAEKTAISLGISEAKVFKILDKNNIDRKKIKHIQIGDKFNKLTVIEFLDYHVTSGGGKKKIFLCKCECGGIRKVRSNDLTSIKEPIKDCGCGWKLIRETAKLKRAEIETKKKELNEIKEQKRLQRKLNKNPPTEKKFKVGYKSHRLTILSEIGTGVNKVFTVECECGTIKEIKRLTLSKTKSCGCLKIEKSTKHGLTSIKDMYKRKWYHRWKGMISRCYNPKIKRYRDYGGRGITVCDRWREPNGKGCENYYNDVHEILGPQPSPNHSLDRINNNGNYEITNLRWATIIEQNKNQRKKNIVL